MEEMVKPEKVELALVTVERNKGAGGIDRMTTGELRKHLEAYWPRIRTKLLEGKYVPSPVRRKEIAKPDGGVRLLGIPTVLDRFIQQLLLQVMTPIYELMFSEHSYGFRPGRSAHDAVRAAQRHAREGKQWVVDMDISKFFDCVNHDILMGKIGQSIRDKRVLRLIGKYLRAGAMLEGVVVRSEEGTPQGGPLSPLLANIYLDALDKELERRGHAFCRYADDCNIYVSSESSAERVLQSISQWITEKLRLQINAKKSGSGEITGAPMCEAGGDTSGWQRTAGPSLPWKVGYAAAFESVTGNGGTMGMDEPANSRSWALRAGFYFLPEAATAHGEWREPAPCKPRWETPS